MANADLDFENLCGFEIEVQENIPAEIEALALYSRIGLEEQALQIVKEALWKHLHRFPVFAEVAIFLVWRFDMKRLNDLQLHVKAQKIDFRDKDERAFLDTVLQIAQLVRGGPKINTISSAPLSRYGLLFEMDPTNPIQVHLFLVGLRFMTWETAQTEIPAEDLQSSIYLNEPKFHNLIEAGMLWEASLMFSNLCEIANLERDNLGKIEWLLESISRQAKILATILKGHSENSDDDSYTRLCQLEVALALVELLLPGHHDHHAIKKLRQKLSLADWLRMSDQTIAYLFEMLPNASHEGRSWKFLQKSERYYSDYRKVLHDYPSQRMERRFGRMVDNRLTVLSLVVSVAAFFFALALHVHHVTNISTAIVTGILTAILVVIWVFSNVAMSVETFTSAAMNRRYDSSRSIGSMEEFSLLEQSRPRRYPELVRKPRSSDQTRRLMASFLT